MVMPAVVLVFALCLSGMQLAPGARLSEESIGSIVCVRATSGGSLRNGLLGAVTLTARSCALAGGT
jgi:hypothetical protein